MKTVDWDAEAAEKAGFEHFMMKEIHEQPKAVQDTLNSALKDDRIDLTEVRTYRKRKSGDISQIYIIACGSAYHVGMAAQYVIEDLARIPVRVELASEFRYRNPILDPHALVIVISQSERPQTVLQHCDCVKSRESRTLAIVNVVGSSIAREADNVFYTLAGPEISVATTKAYSTQLIAAYLLAISLPRSRSRSQRNSIQVILQNSGNSSGESRKIIDDKERIQWFAAKQANANDVFLCRTWNRLCDQYGRQSEDEGDQLCPFRGICGR